MDLGPFYLAIAVQDIATSVAFYQKMGFVPNEGCGSIPEKWMLLSNGDTRIGLFQDMFPENILTFNPDNARELYQHVKEQDISVTMEANIDKPKGPCHFAVVDPDGNTILVDQHGE